MKSTGVRASIYAVAERAKVSISTVSLAINHPERVKASTRERIIDAARELGYRPLSRDGLTRGGHVAGVLVAAPFTTHSSFARRLNGIVTQLQGTGADILVHDLQTAEAADEPLLQALPIRANVDGVIIMGVPLAASASDQLRSWGPPLVAVDAQFGDNPTVLVDDRSGARMLGEYLAGLGHRKLAYVNPQQKSFDYVSAGMLRFEGIREAFTSGVRAAADPVSLIEVDRDQPASFERAATQIAANRDITAVFADHDELAARLLPALARLGLRVPQDVSVVGYDDGTLAEAIGLTTVRQPFEESGRIAAELLQALLAGKRGATQRVMLQPELVIRTSAQ